MSYEQLSAWVAEVGQHDFDHFADAHAWAISDRRSETYYTALRELSALGYVEVDWRRRRWGAVAPCLTLLPDAGGHGLLVGARTAKFTSEIDNRLDDYDAIASRVHQDGAPNAIFIAADSETVLQSVAESLEIAYVHSVVETLAAVLPSLDAELASRRTPPIAHHYGVERWDLEDGWQLIDSDDAPGYYRYELSGPRTAHFVGRDGTRYDVDHAIGTWADARQLGVSDLLIWRRDEVNGTLDAPRFLPLPTLHARAATLCSGLPAERRNDRVGGMCDLYANVPEWLARRIASDLAQDLIIK